MNYKFIYFDVAGTLLYKPALFPTIISTLETYNINAEEQELKKIHKLLSETIKFPQKTTKKFYDFFNSKLLEALRIKPNKLVINRIYENCSYLPWESYSDVEVVKKIPVPKGIISNWDESLLTKLRESLSLHFTYIFKSSKTDSKPNLSIFKKAFSKVGIPFKDILYIGDSIKLDIEPALNLRVRAILIDRDNIFTNFSGEKINSLNGLLNL